MNIIQLTGQSSEKKKRLALSLVILTFNLLKQILLNAF